MYDYGRCHICEGKVEPKRVALDIRVKDRLLVVDQVPVGQCTRCGEKIVRSEVGRQLAALVAAAKRARKKKTLAVPVIAYTADVA